MNVDDLKITMSDKLWEENKMLKKRLAEAVELLEYFTDRVEEGSIRSRTTYEKYKSFLAALSK